MVNTYFFWGGGSVDKEHKFDDNIAEIVLGSTIVSMNNFNGGSLLEKIFVLVGLFILIVGIIRTIVKNKDKKGMIIFLALMGLILSGVFLGLLYRFIFS